MPFTTAGGIRVTGAWTRAGLGSCVRVEGPNKVDDIIFDCGVCEPECLKAGFVFISHGHVDHIGACVMHARAKMLTSKQSIYYVPTESVEPLEDARIAFSKMDGKDIPMNIIPLKPGDIVSVNSDLLVKVFPTIHRVPSQGYALYKKNAGGLLSEYSHLSGREIGEVKKSGVRITAEETESLELVYTGDTVIEGLLQQCNEFIFHSPILIMELTYLDGDRKKATDRGHIHIQDIVENTHRFKNDQIIFVHISERYGPHSKALMMLRDGLPNELLRKSVVSLRSFGSGEHLTEIATVDWNKRRADVGWGWGREINTSSGRHVRPHTVSGNHNNRSMSNLHIQINGNSNSSSNQIIGSNSSSSIHMSGSNSVNSSSSSSQMTGIINESSSSRLTGIDTNQSNHNTILHTTIRSTIDGDVNLYKGRGGGGGGGGREGRGSGRGQGRGGYRGRNYRGGGSGSSRGNGIRFPNRESRGQDGSQTG